MSREYPVVISKFICGAKEVEMDCVAAEGRILNYAISEHVENAGTHSGDATLILPAQNLFVETHRLVKKISQRLSKALNICGPFNLQFLCKANEIKIIECNLRASRTMPFISKALDINFVDIATRVMIGAPYRVQNIHLMELDYVAVKVPVFSFQRLANCDPLLGVEMKSTGEVACFGTNKYEALLKAFVSSGMKIPEKAILVSLGSHDSRFALAPKVAALLNLGFRVFATFGTFQFIASYLRLYAPTDDCAPRLSYDVENYEQDGDFVYHGGEAACMTPPPMCRLEPSWATSETCIEYSKGELVLVHKSGYGQMPSVTEVIAGEVELTVNITTKVNANPNSEHYRIRRFSIDCGVSLVTNEKLAALIFDALIREKRLNEHGKTMLNATRYDKYY